MKDGTIGVLVVEDDDDFCFLIGDTLGREPDMRILGSTASGEEAVYLSLEELDGIEAARKIRLYTRAKVILVTAFEAQSIVIDACKRSFASSYVFKSQFSILTETVRQTAEGPTPQEYLIASLILADLSPAEQSVCLMMLGRDVHLQSSQKTIANQKTALLKKLGLKSQKELEHLFHGMQV